MEEELSIDQLRPGIYINLEMSWMDHPFTFNKFLITSDSQIKTLKAMKLKSIKYDPSKSTVSPKPVTQETVEAAPSTEVIADDQSHIEAKRQRIAVMREKREAIGRVEKQFIQAAGAIKNINNNLFSQPAKTIEEATSLVKQMVSSMMEDIDVAIHLMHSKNIQEDMYHHALNVSVLCLMLGRKLGLSQEKINTLGLGALLHDIGLSNVPTTITRKLEPLNKAEQNFLQLHCQYGVETGKKIGLKPEIIEILQHHHETADAKGYPDGLLGKDTSELSKIVEIVNAYDELCNQPNHTKSMTPYEALSHMFLKQRAQHDPEILNTFIRCMGVYPPGTVAILSNEMYCIVTSVNTKMPMRPVVMIYDKATPKTEAILLDLQDEPEITIVKAVRPANLPKEIFDYLNPRGNSVYYFDQSGKMK